jgi:Icc-related predicted phosphoesterase
MAKAEVVRVGAVADLHYTKASAGSAQGLFEQAAKLADLLLLAGDLTDFGLVEEAQALAKDLSAFARLPIVAVLGNHDHEAGHADQIATVLRDAGVTVLDGDACEVRGIGIGGAKGFLGGFGRGTLEAWGEPAVKQFVREAIDESLKLERALARLRTPQRLALLHYAPVRETVEGEPPEIFAFLGCSRLEEPINRFGVQAVVHGHAHRGTAVGKTSTGIPVYNVALPLMKKMKPDGAPLQVLELPVEPAKESGAGDGAAKGAATPRAGKA